MGLAIPPFGGGRDRGPHHPVAERDDESALLGDIDEVGGLNEPRLRMHPSDQCFESDGTSGGQLHDRLVANLEGVVLDRLVKFGADLHALEDRGVQLGLVAPPLSLAAPLAT